MSDLISRQAVLDAVNDCGICIQKILDIPSAESERKWTAHEVACILAELFGDDCACDYCGIDEWLPEKCDFGTLCPDKDLCGVTCWEQYLKHRGDR